MFPILPDADVRALIREGLDETMAIEAAAGTGKTTVLVDRIVNVLVTGRATVDRLVAVTFTERAAGELKLRLRGCLEIARVEAKAPERRQALERALGSLEQAHVSTIHGFCADLLRERPVEARVDPQFVTLTEAQAQRLFHDVFGDWLESELEAPSPGVRRALRRSGYEDEGGSVGRLERAAWSLAEWRDMQSRWRRPGFDQQARVDELVRELEQFAALSGEPADRQDPLFESTAPARRLHQDVTLAEQVRSREYDGLEARLVDLHTYSFRNPRRGRQSAPYRRGLPRAQVLSAHQRLVVLLEAFRRDANADLAALLQTELQECLDRYRVAKAAAGALDFLDLLVLARDLVRDHDFVRRDFQQRFTHIFVDEFQDTDPLQAELLLLLAADDPAERDWRRVKPAPGRLFIVGDPKQSIYRFRRADVGTYQEVRAQLARHGARCEALTASFRSPPTIQSAVNAAFAPLMQQSADTLQAGYVPLAAVRPDRPGQPSVVVLPVPRPFGAWDKVTKTAISESLPGAVGAFIDWLVNRSNWQITERDHPTRLQPIAPRHVCLLFRRFDTRVFGAGGNWMQDVTRPYVQALEARGIRHLLVGGKSFHDREEVESMRTALQAVERPEDELSAFGTLRGALFAFGDELLFEYRAVAGRINPFRLPKDVPEKLAPIVAVLELLRELHQRRNHRPVAETIGRLLDASRAHAIFALRHSGEQALANVQYIAELARQYEADGGISFRGFVDELHAQADSTRSAEAPILEEGSDGVRLMTAHKAKGLEFPVVVLADISAELSRKSASRWVDIATGRCAISLAGWDPADLLDNEAQEIRRDEAEGIRVAYVAATRARDLLIVPAVGDAPFESGWINPLNRAIYPPLETRRRPSVAVGCPAFGGDSVVDRQDTVPFTSVRPGLYRMTGGAGPGTEDSDTETGGTGTGAYDVVWWDPSRLDLDKETTYGLRRDDLISPNGSEEDDDEGLMRYHTWRVGRERAIEQGATPSLRVMTVRARAARDAAAEAPPVPVERVAVDGRRYAAGGPGFGVLVHAVLAVVPLDASASGIEDVCAQQARVLGASAGEVERAVQIVRSTLRHPLLQRANASAARGALRREMPVALCDPDAAVVEGVVDLAFEEDGAWTIVDFKTDAEIGDALPTYQRQVQLYAEAIARATGQPATGVILRL